MYLFKNQSSGFLRFDISEDKTDFRIFLDMDKLYTEGRELTKQILTLIQTFKSTADIDEARKFYAQYSKVDEDFLTIRQIVLANRQPRRIVGSHNLFLGDDTVLFTTYDTTHTGLITSFIDRFDTSKEFMNQFIGEWKKTAKFIKA